MKRIALAIALALIATGCSSRLASLGRLFPDGSSFSIDEINGQASMTGAGSLVLRGVKCVGTNGFALTGDSITNVISTGVTTIRTRSVK